MPSVHLNYFPNREIGPQMTTKKSTEKQSERLEIAIGGIISLWFGARIKDHASSEKGFDLQPHAAVCLAIMTTKSVATSDSMSAQLARFGFNMFEWTEADIIVEYGMQSLKQGGLVKLDAQGKKEHDLARESRTYGSRGVHWTLTHAGAKRAAPFYCSHNGKPSEYQKQAIEDILAANKEAIQNSHASKLKAESVVPKAGKSVKAKASPVKEIAKRKSA